MDGKQPIIDKCEGCQHVENGYCTSYLYPSAKWRAGNCPMATHTKAETKKSASKVNPLKASKRRKMGT